MRRRDFLQGIAAAAAGIKVLSGSGAASAQDNLVVPQKSWKKASDVSVEGHKLVAEFTNEADSWKVVRRPANARGISYVSVIIRQCADTYKECRSVDARRRSLPGSYA